MQTGWKPTCRQTDRLEAYPTFLGRMVADGRSSIVKNRRCSVFADKIRDTVPSVEGQKRQSNELHGNEESLEKPRGKSVSPENSKAFQMEAAGIEPASRDTSNRASTCLADSYLSRPLRSLLASVQCASLELF